MAQIATINATYVIKETYQDALNKWKANETDFFDLTRLVKIGTSKEESVWAPMTVHGSMVVAVLKGTDE